MLPSPMNIGLSKLINDLSVRQSKLSNIFGNAITIFTRDGKVGYPPRRIWEIATDDWGLRTPKRKRMGGQPISLSSVYKVLTNPFYAGVIQSGGKSFPGKHRPMITTDDFERVQALLGRPGVPRKTRVFAYTGMMRCGECGCAITAEEKTNRFGSRYTYYHCTKRRLRLDCSQPYLPLAE